MERPRAGAPVEGRRIEIRGTVQGVGMRPFVYRLARALGVRGRVRNDARGVTIEAFAEARALDDFQRRLRDERPPAAAFDEVRADPIAPEPVADFAIVASDSADERRVSIPPDLATCPACLAEVREPSDRRHRYPFTNCTDCGPRFTIARDVPYDRAATTMAPFRMCEGCRREYQDPGNRRFHAEPNACPACGPRLSLRSASGEPVPGKDPLGAAAAALRQGRVVAVKGLGGFHLACDATSPEAVRRLRERKRREEKPLAVMARDLGEAERLAAISEAERDLLASVERPIVLLRRREGAGLAPEVAPDSPLLGLFLPYTPLHHLLLEAASRPLVMTSGNLSEEPIAFRDREALQRLTGIADLFLLHDREIESRADDSVARLVAGRPVLLRRSRGYVPRPIGLRRRLSRPVLACGAHKKNTFCLAAGDQATLGPHVGDLENLETYDSLAEAVERMERFLRLRPEVLACDLHPLYLSTRYARERAAALGAPLVPVQHHHAHLVAAMAEHGLEGPVLGLAWDGTGYGPDGAAWGGELLLADARGFERLATFRPVALAGGELAIREPWRVALAALDDAFAGDPPLSRLALFRDVPAERVALVRRMIGSGLNAPAAHGAGRLFDAAGAIALSRPVSRYEGQVAVALDNAADPAERGRYPFALDLSADPWRLDWRPLLRALVADLLDGNGAARAAARFHESLGAAAGELLRAAAARRGRLPVVLSGGCFQNARLAEGVLGALGGFEVYLHQRVPPGDGGLALGQALVADAATRGPPWAKGA
ncbi:MAG TPA: carbamoyltransferase HypF [Anaeromyxobacteraceae bacterium]|nr:carbamoyltransferase HypF [Anaeromyxobacteraceae bacterium]